MLPRETAYDRVQYPTAPLATGRVEHLSAIAVANGIPAASPDRCRFLEIGCGTGWHLIALAFAHPESEFVGIDLAASAIAAGQRIIAANGLSNVRLLHYDLTEIGDSFGEFDYILAHGLYTWIPEPVARRLLEVIAERLAPNGTACVSYNITPYSRLRNMMREIAQYHFSAWPEDTSAGRALELFDFLSRASRRSNIVQLAAADERKKAAQSGLGYASHDVLGEVFRLISYSDFARSAAACGLQPFDEAGFTARESLLKEETLRTLRGRKLDPVRYQQYLDYLEIGAFRRTLLCHAGLERGEERIPLERFHAAAQLELRSEKGQTAVVRRDGGNLLTSDRKLILALERLTAAWPGSVPSAALGLDHSQIWALYRNGFLMLQQSPSTAAMPGGRPLAQRLVRAQLAAGQEFVHNPYHQAIRLEPPANRLVAWCDGSHTREELTALMGTLAEAAASQDLRGDVDRNLEALGRLGLFAG
jgi:SAM-dependent methyltransferase